MQSVFGCLDAVQGVAGQWKKTLKWNEDLASCGLVMPSQANRIRWAGQRIQDNYSSTVGYVDGCASGMLLCSDSSWEIR